MTDLCWHCAHCGAHEAVRPTGAPDNEYALGDHEPCECGGTVRVMTTRQAACLEQGLALGMTARSALAQAMELKP